MDWVRWKNLPDFLQMNCSFETWLKKKERLSVDLHVLLHLFHYLHHHPLLLLLLLLHQNLEEV